MTVNYLNRILKINEHNWLNISVVDEVAPRFNELQNISELIIEYKKKGAKGCISVDNGGLDLEIFELKRLELYFSYLDFFKKKGLPFITYFKESNKYLDQIDDFIKHISGNQIWRYNSSILGISIPGISAAPRAHIDPFDVMISQVSGTRIWELWDTPELEYIIRSQIDDKPYEWIPKKQPKLVITLERGQTLLLPAFVPHHPYTPKNGTEPCISVASSWQAHTLLTTLNRRDDLSYNDHLKEMVSKNLYLIERDISNNLFYEDWKERLLNFEQNF